MFRIVALTLNLNKNENDAEMFACPIFGAYVGIRLCRFPDQSEHIIRH